MSVAIPIPLLQNLPDVAVTLGVGVDEYALVYDHDTRLFALRAPFDGTPYALLAGRAGGQTLYGGTAANDDITIEPTSHGTKTSAYVLLAPSGGKVGIGITPPLYALHVVENNPGSGSIYHDNIAEGSPVAHSFIALHTRDTGGDPQIGWGIKDSAGAGVSSWHMGIDNDDDDNIKLAAGAIGAADLFTFTRTGRQGIGTTIPGAKLGFAAGTTAADGIDFGGDVSLYRLGADVLATDDTFKISGFTSFLSLTGKSPSTGTVFLTSVAGDAASGRFQITAEGALDWGNGTDAYDTNLYRSGANVLATDDTFKIAGANAFLSLSGKTAVTTQVFSSGVAGDAGVGRLIIYADGKLSWSNGTDAEDTTLYRSAANVLATDDTFKIAGASTYLSLGGKAAASTTIISTAVAGDAGVGRLVILADGTHNWANGADAADTTLYRSGVNTLTTGILQCAIATATNNAVTTNLIIASNVTSVGVGAAGFGPAIKFNAETTTTANTAQAAIEASWIVPTDASYTARLAFKAWDKAGAREGLRIDSNGSAALLGFYGHAAAAQPAAYTPSNVTPGRAFDADTVLVAELADIVGTLIADLQTLGLVA